MKLNVMMLSQEAFNFEMKSDGDFGSVLKKYMEEQKLSVNELAKKSGLSPNAVIKYRSGHIPSDYIVLVMLCIGLKINYSKAEYLFSLAHLTLGSDKKSLVYKLLINLSFASDITIEQCNDYLIRLGFPKLKTTTNFMQEDDYEIRIHIIEQS